MDRLRRHVPTSSPPLNRGGRRLHCARTAAVVGLLALVARVDGEACVAFSPDGKTLAVGGAPESLQIRVLDVASGELRRNLRHPDAKEGKGVECLDLIAFSRTGDSIVSKVGGSYPRLTVWQWPSGRETRRLTLRRGQFAACGARLSANGRMLVFPGDLAEALVLDVAKGSQRSLKLLEPTEEQDPRKRGGVDFSISPDGDTLLSPRCERLDVWDLVSFRFVRVIPGTEFMHSITFSPDAKTLAFAGRSARYEVLLCDSATGGGQRRLSGLPADAIVHQPSFAPDGRRIAALADRYAAHRPKPLASSRLLAQWELPSGKLLRAVTVGEVQAFSFSPDGMTLATLDGAATVRFLEVASGRDRAAPAKP